MARKINERGLDIVKKREGLYLRAYRCPAGVPTIGYGHTGPDVHMGLAITKERAEYLLELDMLKFSSAVEECCRGIKLSDNQFSALVSFTFNVGSGALIRSTLLKKLKAGDYAGAADEFRKWNKARMNGKLVPLKGLTIRRELERALFLTSDTQQV